MVSSHLFHVGVDTPYSRAVADVSHRGKIP
jgi:hypothetical protein